MISRQLRIYAAIYLAVMANSVLGEKKDASAGIDGKATDFVIEEQIHVDKIWSAVQVGFCLLTHKDQQYVAYFDSERRMVVAMRSVGEDRFTRQVLSSRQGWDSHNYITMAVDSEGHLHLSGNMHAVPLVYFRSQEPGDVTTLKQVPEMVGKNERRCTYPQFMKTQDGRLIFHYRDGGSGNGQEIYNIYDAKTRTWRRFFEKSLISGEGASSAYMRGPKLGPDGWFHLLWMWRDTPDVATNHDLSYARSRDLQHWETAAGEELSMPITPAQRGCIVDPVPVEGGLHNSNHHFGFDSHERIAVSYFKHDSDGNTQAYVARHSKGRWQIRAVSDWQGRHLFKGGGTGPATFGTSLRIGAISVYKEGQLALPFSHWKAGSGQLLIDEETLEPVEVVGKAKRFPSSLYEVTSGFPGMRVRLRGAIGESPEKDVRYVMRWECLGSNRDRPRAGELPDNSDLVVYKIRAGAQEER